MDQLALSSMVRRLLLLPLHVAKVQLSVVLRLGGVSWEDLSFPSRTPGRPFSVDLILRLAQYWIKLFKLLFYPQVFFRNIAFAILFQGIYEFGGLIWRRVRKRLSLFTKSGRRLHQLMSEMESAETYLQFRTAEKTYQTVLGAGKEAMNAEEQSICDQLDRRFKRYRTFIRNNDVRRLQFELRSDLLRKHFGHDQFHPSVRAAIQRYVGIVCCAFGLLASGSIPTPLRGLVFEDNEDHDFHDSLDRFEDGHVKMKHSPSLVEMPDMDQLESDEEMEDEQGENGDDFEVKRVHKQRPDREGEEDEEEEEGSEDEYEREADDFIAALPNGKPILTRTHSMSSTSSNEFTHLGSTLESQLSLARSRLDFFVETRHSFGRSALLLSGGARMGLYHVGVVKTLMDHNLLPRVLSGSSAGSIIAAVLGCKTDEEIRSQLFEPSKMNLRFFGRSDSIDSGLQAILRGDPLPEMVKESLLAAFTGEEREKGNSLLGTLLMLLPPPFPSYILLLRKLLPRWYDSKVLLDINILKTAIRNVIGDMTFQEAFDRTGRIINITATPHGGDRDVPNLLNYLSAPYVTVWSAACASCCIPGVFAPVTLVAKTIDGTLEPYNPAGLRWIDGSLEADLPMQRLGELFNINHFIVSQVNPHAQVLAPHDHTELEYMPYWDRRVLLSLGRAIRFCRDQGRSYLKHMSSFGLKSSVFRPLGAGLVPVLTQKYGGDVTLYPKMKPGDLSKLLQNPTDEEYLECILEGERMTWPKLQSIRRRCMVEFMLDDCVHAMQAQIKALEKKWRTSLPPSRSMQLSPPIPHYQKPSMSRVSSYSVFGMGHDHIQEPVESAASPSYPSGAITSSSVSPSSVSTPAARHDESQHRQTGLAENSSLHTSLASSSGLHSPPVQSFAPTRVPPTANGDYSDANQHHRQQHSQRRDNLTSKLMGRIQSVQALSSLADQYPPANSSSSKFGDDGQQLYEEDFYEESDDEEEEHV